MSGAAACCRSDFLWAGRPAAARGGGVLGAVFLWAAAAGVRGPKRNVAGAPRRWPVVAAQRGVAAALNGRPPPCAPRKPAQRLFTAAAFLSLPPSFGAAFSAQHGLHASAEHQGGQEGARRVTYQELAASQMRSAQTTAS